MNFFWIRKFLNNGTQTFKSIILYFKQIYLKQYYTLLPISSSLNIFFFVCINVKSNFKLNLHYCTTKRHIFTYVYIVVKNIYNVQLYNNIIITIQLLQHWNNRGSIIKEK